MINCALAVAISWLGLPSYGKTDMQAGVALINESFQTDPSDRGWASDKFWAHGDETVAEWLDGQDGQGKPCVKVSRGVWRSPKFKVEPLSYCRIRFSSKSAGRGVWIMQCIDADGNDIVADSASGIDVSDGWVRTESFAMTRENAVAARLLFVPDDEPIFISDVDVTVAGRDQALAWIDSVYQQLEPIRPEELPPDRWEHLPGTMEKLRTGKALRIVALGASIGNDICNSHYHLLIERMYPGATVTVIPSVRERTGADFYEKDNRIQRHILDYKPDLLVIDCYRKEIDSIRSVIRQVRKQRSMEVLVTVVCGTKPRSAEDRAGDRQFLADLAKAGDENGFGVLDIRAAWERYVETAPGGARAFSRDDVHYNDRGKQIVGRIMAGFFAPEAPAPTTNE